MNSLVIDCNVCAVILNAAVGQTRTDLGYFEGAKLKPALGKSFAGLVDLSIFLDEDNLDGNEFQMRRLRVLKDHFGDREGRWIPFQTDGISFKTS